MPVTLDVLKRELRKNLLKVVTEVLSDVKEELEGQIETIINESLENLQIGWEDIVDRPTSSPQELDAVVSEAIRKNGISGSFTTVDGKTITVSDGQITSIVSE